MKKQFKPDLNLQIIGNRAKYEKQKLNAISKTQPNKYILERKIMTKAYTPLSEVIFNLKDDKNDNKFFFSKTKRLGKYNPNKKIVDKELIIDTRSQLYKKRQNHSSDSNKKQKYLDNKNKSYLRKEKSKKVYPQKIIRLKTYSKEYISYLNSHKKLKPYNFDLNINFNNTHKMNDSIHSILNIKKNEFMEAYNKLKDKEKKWSIFPKTSQKQFIMDNTPMANFFSRKKDIKAYISPKQVLLPYLSVLDDDYLISEKLRFQNMMQKLTKLKACIEGNSKKEYEIIKEFLLNNKLFEVENFQPYKLKNFVHFIKGDFYLDPSKNIKENILDILNGKEIERPNISPEMKIEMNMYQNTLLKQNLINKENNFQMDQKENSDNCIVKNLKRYPNKILMNESNKESIQITKPKNKINNKIDIEKNDLSPIYFKSFTKAEMIEHLLEKKYREREKFHYSPKLTDKEKQILKNFKCLPLNLRRQKEIYMSNIENLDLDEKPKIIINLLEKKFKEEEKENLELRAKTISNWKKVIKINNEKLYGEKKNNSDYEELKKRNMLTEYICLQKAKNKYEIQKLQQKYKI